MIVGWPLVPEDVNASVHPERLARLVERQLAETPERAAQIAGFEELADRMKTDVAPAEAAAKVVVDHIKGL